MTHINNVLGGKEESPLRRAVENIQSYPGFRNMSLRRLEELEVYVYIDALQNFESDGQSVIISIPPSSPPLRRGREVWIHVTGSWVGPRDGLDVKSNTEIRPSQEQAIMSSNLSPVTKMRHSNFI
jgi:hypothetical protein